jgi:choline-sulfatase
MHFNRPGRPGLFGFDTCATEDVIEREWRQRQLAQTVPEGIRTKPRWRPFQDPARIWLNAEKLPYPRYDGDMQGTFIARKAEQYLEQRRTDAKPFALWVSFMEPHSPFDFPIEDRERFSPAAFAPPRLGPEDPPFIPEVFQDLKDDEKKGIIASYFTSVRFLDRNVSRVLSRIATLGMDRNTLIVYTADHGYFLGQHGRFEKHYGYDPALRVPLLARWPGRLKPGVIQGMTEHVDLSSTILDMMEVDPLPGQHGQSLRPYLEGRGAAHPRDHVFAEYLETEQAYIRTERYKFIYSTGKRQDWYHPVRPSTTSWRRLYDLKKDPDEFHNVADAHPDLVLSMEKLIVDRLRKTHPDANNEPAGLALEPAMDFFLRPRDA